MNASLKTVALAAFALTVGLTSCNRQDSFAPETRALGVDESVVDLADRHMEGPVDAMTLRHGGGTPCGGESPFVPECVTVTDSGEGAYPRTLTLEFGEGCEGPNGMPRSGVIEIVVTGDLGTEIGATRTATFDGFQVGNVTMTGTRVLTFEGENEDGLPTYSQNHDVTVSRNGHTLTRTYAGTLTWLEGFDTEPCDDNVVQRDGVATHETSGAWGGSTRTLDAVVHSRPCGYPNSGTVTVDRPQHDVVIDFGDGECDNLATVTRNGNTYILNLDTHEIEG